MSLTGLHITLANTSDADRLSELACRTFTESFGYLYEPVYLAEHLQNTCSAAYFKQAMSQGDLIVIAELDNQLVGYTKAGTVGLPVTPNFPAMELHRLYVASSHQGHRIGDALIQRILHLPALEAAQGIYVGVWENNDRAQRMYQKYGFTPVGEYLYCVGPHRDREIIMLKRQAVP